MDLRRKQRSRENALTEEPLARGRRAVAGTPAPAVAAHRASLRESAEANLGAAPDGPALDCMSVRKIKGRAATPMPPGGAGPCPVAEWKPFHDRPTASSATPLPRRSKRSAPSLRCEPPLHHRIDRCARAHQEISSVCYVDAGAAPGRWGGDRNTKRRSRMRNIPARWPTGSYRDEILFVHARKSAATSPQASSSRWL